MCNDPHKQLLLTQVSAVLISVQSPGGDKETGVTLGVVLPDKQATPSQDAADSWCLQAAGIFI